MNNKVLPARGFGVRSVVQSIPTRTVALLLVGAFAGCSGGGDEAGGAPGPVVYTGNSNAAVITTSNAARITASVIGGASVSQALSGATSGGEASGAREVARELGSALRAITLPSGSRASQLTSAPVDNTELCDSGSIHSVGDIGPNGTGTLNISWNNCRKGTSTLNGSGVGRIDAFDTGLGIMTDGTLTFQRLTLTRSAGSVDNSGSVRTQVNIGASTETITSNIVILASTGRMTKTENFVVVDVYNNIFAPTSLTDSMSGRVFDGTHGFVDVLTNTGFVFATLNQSFPDSGEAVLTGAVNAHIRFTALSPRAVELRLDVDGNGIFERTAFLPWVDLAGPSGSDLRDSDGDGMHDSWETANALNPNINDATLDPDGDGASNLAEYQAGSDPKSAASIP